MAFACNCTLGKNVHQTPYTKAVGFVKPHYFGFYTSRGVGTRSVCRFVNNRHCSQPPWPKVLGYIMAKMYEDGSLAILNVNINKDHKIKMDINLKFDSQGNLIPYNGKESGSHAHEWHERADGKMARKPVSKEENSHLPIPSEYSSLINHIVEFNKKKNHKK